MTESEGVRGQRDPEGEEFELEGSVLKGKPEEPPVTMVEWDLERASFKSTVASQLPGSTAWQSRGIISGIVEDAGTG